MFYKSTLIQHYFPLTYVCSNVLHNLSCPSKNLFNVSDKPILNSYLWKREQSDPDILKVCTGDSGVSYCWVRASLAGCSSASIDNSKHVLVCWIGPFDCTFDVDEDPLCTWEDDYTYGASAGEIRWTRNRGVTPSTGTGPEKDHTSGSGIYYLYFETNQLSKKEMHWFIISHFGK